jgi:hypothetical protein
VVTLVEFLNTRYDETEDGAWAHHRLSCRTVVWQPARQPCNCGVPDQIRRRVTAARGIIRWHDQVRREAGVPSDLHMTMYGVAFDYPLRCLAVEFATHPDYRHEWTPQ